MNTQAWHMLATKGQNKMDTSKVELKSINEFRGQYRWLSNFHLIPITFEGITYPSTEHAYQAAKTFDYDIKRAFLPLTCAKAKLRGGTIVRRSDWFKVNHKIMKEVNRIKFQDPELRQKLLDTGNAELIEGNTWGDTYWGVCEGKGENHLGRILMEIREEIRNENEFYFRLALIVGEGF